MTRACLAPAFLARFKCLGADCEDTCCKGWNMQVDPVTQQRWQAESPALLESMSGTGEDAVMKRDAKSDFCVKFAGGLCGIQSKEGEDFLGDACYLYPRVTRSLGSQVTMTAAMSCPEIVRQALFIDDAFEEREIEAERLPQSMQDYLPEGLEPPQALAIHRAFLGAVLAPDVTPELAFMRIFVAAQSLSRITASAWPGAVPFYLQHADAALPAPEPRATDPVYLLQALCGLVAAAKYVHHARLMHTIRDIEGALHASIRWDTLAIASLPDSAHAAESLLARWRTEWQPRYATLLKRCLAMQLSLALFPFGGFGGSLPERAAVIGVRMATLRLALMGACHAANGEPAQGEIVRVVQSLSRFLDHLSGATFSIQIYTETGWLNGGRLRAILS